MKNMKASSFARGSRTPRRDAGFILIFCVLGLILIAGLSSAFLSLSLSSIRSARAQASNTQAFYVAESALNETVLRITNEFEKGSLDPEDLSARFVEIDAIDAPGDGADTIFTDPDTGAVFDGMPIGIGSARVWVRNNGATIYDSMAQPIGEGRDVQVIASGTVDGVVMSAQKNLRFQVTNTHKFDFALLANELPECMFCHLDVNGDLGQVSTGRFRMWLAYDSTGYERTSIYGDFYLKGTYSSTSYYTSGASGGNNQERMVTDTGGKIYPSYTGEKLADWGQIRDYFQPGSWYDALATKQAASIQFSSTPAATLQNSISNGQSFMAVIPTGSSLATTTPSISTVGPIVNGHLTLIGTPSNPIVLNKSITVHGDVLIKGTVSGIGNINASGNIFVADSIRYAKPPSNIAQAENGAADGTPADKLGLSSASNIMVGDLTDQKTARFLRTQFIDVQGSGLEYVPAEYLNNRYALDGDRDLNTRTVGSHTVTAPGFLPQGATNGYYNSSNGFSYTGGWLTWSLLDTVSNKQMDRIDATLFADFAIAGGQPSATSLITLNGGAIGNEIGVLSAKKNFSTGFVINYDSRNRLGNPMGFPLEVAVFETGWLRIPPRL